MCDCHIADATVKAMNPPSKEHRGRFADTWLWIAGCYGVANVVAHREILRLCIWMRMLNT